MCKKRKIDYIIEQEDDERLVFRFYPRRSSCHGFGNEPPKSWSDVYKVYYSYAIIKQWKFNSEDQWESKIMFSSGCDECSAIDEVAFVCSQLYEGKEVFIREDRHEIQLLNRPIMAFGMGVDWTISKHVCIYEDWDEEDLQHCSNMDEVWDCAKEIQKVYYTFMLFDYWGKGFKFTLEDKDVKAFGEYLLGCCEYMLAHGDPI